MEVIRAYSTMNIKAATDAGGKRKFVGIASTPSTDRMGDIVEPKGMEINLPTPLLWQHNAREPIGWVTAARVSSSGIECDCEVANVEEDGPLKARLLDAWQQLRAGLVRGLSIGFNAVESARIEGTYGYRYIRTLLLELSCVTIPANADCSITAIKAADAVIRRAALGAHGEGRVVRLDPAPAASGLILPGASGASATTRRKGVVYLD